MRSNDYDEAAMETMIPKFFEPIKQHMEEDD